MKKSVKLLSLLMVVCLLLSSCAQGAIGIADANNMPVACYLARGKIRRNMDASHRDVDMVRVCKMTSNVSVGLLGCQYSSFPCNLLSI